MHGNSYSRLSIYISLHQRAVTLRSDIKVNYIARDVGRIHDQLFRGACHVYNYAYDRHFQGSLQGDRSRIRYATENIDYNLGKKLETSRKGLRKLHSMRRRTTFRRFFVTFGVQQSSHALGLCSIATVT